MSGGVVLECIIFRGAKTLETKIVNNTLQYHSTTHYDLSNTHEVQLSPLKQFQQKLRLNLCKCRILGRGAALD